jgi:hypothetical protein
MSDNAERHPISGRRAMVCDQAVKVAVAVVIECCDVDETESELGR